MKKLVVSFLAAVMLLGTLSGCGRTDAREQYTEAVKALEDGKYEEAVSGFTAVTESGYYLADGYRGLGLSYMCSSDYAHACISFEKCLLEVNRESLAFTRDVNLYLAYSREHNGETEAANEIYEELLKKDSKDSEVLYLLGRSYLNHGEQKEAKKLFDRALDANRDYDLYINIFQCFERLDQGADGAEYLERALDIANQNPDDYYNKGLVHYYLQNYDEARDLLIEALNKEAGNPKAVFLLGEVYLAMDDVANARAVYTQYAQSEESAAASYNGLALCDLSEGNYESALQNIEKGLEYNDPDVNQGLLFNEIVVYENHHDWANAKVKAVAYIAKYPTDEAGLREYEFLKTR